MPADDLTDPAPATTFAHLDAPTVLSRAIAELGIYPAVDPLDSSSRMLDARILGQEHYDCARGVQMILQVMLVPAVLQLCRPPYLLWAGMGLKHARPQAGSMSRSPSAAAWSALSKTSTCDDFPGASPASAND